MAAEVGAKAQVLLSKAGAMAAVGVGAAQDAVAAIPVPPQVGDTYALVFGETGPMEFAKEWLPILYVTALPLLCLLCACCGTCNSPKKNMGTRILRRVNLTVQANTRILMAASPAKKKGAAGKAYNALSDAEKGKVVKNKTPVRPPSHPFRPPSHYFVGPPFTACLSHTRGLRPGAASPRVCPSRLSSGCVRVPQENKKEESAIKTGAAKKDKRRY